MSTVNWQKAIKDERIVEINGQDIAEGHLPPWRPLAIFCLYRLLIVSLLLVAVITGAGPGFLGESHPNLFLIVGLVYAAAGVATVARMGGFYFRVWFQVNLGLALLLS